MTTEFLGTLRTLAYLAAGMLFILSLRGLSTQETARRGNVLGTVGMALAVVITALVFVASLGQGTTASVDAVASSRIRMRGSMISARAIASRWRWPPESVIPRSPITVS